jgi:hypothetical protein
MTDHHVGGADRNRIERRVYRERKVGAFARGANLSLAGLDDGTFGNMVGRNGRGEWIRTTGLTVPNRALYQAEPRPDPL